MNRIVSYPHYRSKPQGPMKCFIIITIFTHHLLIMTYNTAKQPPLFGQGGKEILVFRINVKKVRTVSQLFCLMCC